MSERDDKGRAGASELRNGVLDLPVPSSAGPDNVRAMTTSLFWDYPAMRLNGAKAGDRRLTLACELPDVGETWTLTMRHGTLGHFAGGGESADATVTIDRADLDRVILKATTLEAPLGDGTARIEGDAGALHDLLATSTSGSTSSPRSGTADSHRKDTLCL